MQDTIRAILEDVLPGVDLDSNTLADDGYIDSISVVNIIAELDLEYDVQVPFEELVNENFNSIEAIAALVKRLKGM